jgi:hypothetical protein
LSLSTNNFAGFFFGRASELVNDIRPGRTSAVTVPIETRVNFGRTFDRLITLSV